jgi:hypothetical protein
LELPANRLPEGDLINEPKDRGTFDRTHVRNHPGATDMPGKQPKTERGRRCFEREQRIRAAPAAVFPLLCPVREYDWIPEWECRLIYTESGLAELGGIFQTDREADGGIDTWVVSRHEPNRAIAFVRVNELRAMLYEIDLEPMGEDASRLTWRQTVTALNEAGDRHVVALREEDFARTIDTLEALLNDYLDPGD